MSEGWFVKVGPRQINRESLLANREFPFVGTYFYFIFVTSKKGIIE